MLTRIALLSLIATSTSVFAADTITVDALAASDSTNKSFIGKRVVVKASKFGELGFYEAKHPSTTFVCDSGVKSLTVKKPKPATFEGVIVKGEGWEGTDVWSLKDCKSEGATTSASSSTTTASPSPSAGASDGSFKYAVGDNKTWGGDLVIKGSKVNISTENANGQCSFDGNLYIKSETIAEVVASDSSCKLALAFGSDSVKVKAGANCARDHCGARGSGFDYTFKKAK